MDLALLTLSFPSCLRKCYMLRAPHQNLHRFGHMFVTKLYIHPYSFTQNRIGVANCQERYMLLTKNYIESIRSFGESIYLFPKVLGKIGELR